MLMKLEKDRLYAKVDSLEANLDQVKESKDDDNTGANMQSFDQGNSPARTQ